MPYVTRFLILFVTIFSLVATGTALTVFSDYAATLAYYDDTARNMAQVVAANIDRLARNADIALERTTAVVGAAGGSDGVRGDQIAWGRIRTHLDPVMEADSIWVVNRHGDVVAESSSFPGAALNVADRTYFQAARQHTALFIGRAIRSRFTDRVVITLTRGLRDRDGAFDGLVGINVQAGWLAAFYALLEPQMLPDIGIFRRDGQVVFANRDLEAMVGRDAGPVPRWQNLLAGTAAAGPLDRIDADRRLTGRVDLPAYDLKVVVRLDPDPVLERWLVRTRNVSVIAGLGAISLFVVIVLGLRSWERERAAVVAAGEAVRDLALARHDTLTGLPSRGLFFELAGALAARAVRGGDMLGVLYIDLDGFKHVNDLLGHDRGDQVLVETARVIRNVVRAGDVSGRIGGDEFVVCVAAPAEVIGRVMQDVAEAIRLGIAAIGDGIACSIGSAHCPAAAADLHALLRQADGAMRQAKAGGKNRVVIT